MRTSIRRPFGLPWAIPLLAAFMLILTGCHHYYGHHYKGHGYSHYRSYDGHHGHHRYGHRHRRYHHY